LHVVAVFALDPKRVKDGPLFRQGLASVCLSGGLFVFGGEMKHHGKEKKEHEKKHEGKKKHGKHEGKK